MGYEITIKAVVKDGAIEGNVEEDVLADCEGAVQDTLKEWGYQS